jgi:hypothetical protein
MTPSFNYINVCFKSDSSLSCFRLLFFSSYEMLFSGMTKLSIRTHNACHADLCPLLKELKAAKRYFRWSKIVQSSQSFQSGIGICHSHAWESVLGGRWNSREMLSGRVPPPPLPACRHVDMPASTQAAWPTWPDGVVRRC